MNRSAISLLALIILITSLLTTIEFTQAASANTWTEKAPMQTARSSLGTAVVDGKIYAIGGSTFSGGSGDQNGALPSTGGAVGTNEMYDPQTDTWVFKDQTCLHQEAILL